MIGFACNHCGRNLRARDDLRGRLAQCPQCGGQVPVPASAADSPAGAARTTVTASPAETQTAPTRPQPAVSAGAAAAFADLLAPPLLPGELGRLGPYRVLKLLGAGGMGLVFQAEDTQLKRSVALKVLKPDVAAGEGARRRFLREAQAAASLTHDHVITIYQVGEAGGIPFLAMPLLKGEPLEERLRRAGALPLPEVLRVGRETAEGLAAAHARGLIHRDIKPANLWLEAGTGRVKILDFGLARAAAEDAHLTQPGLVLGTPHYMAPEQAAGETVDHRADLFSLGCVLYRMSAGELPFQGANTIAVLRAVAIGQVRPLGEVNPALPPALTDLVMQLLATDPAARPASARAVADRLRAIPAPPRAAVAPDADRTSGLAAGPPPTLAERPPRPTRARGGPDQIGPRPAVPPWVWVAGAFAVLVLVVGGTLLARALSGDGSETRPPGPDPGAVLVQPAPPPEVGRPAGWMTFSPPDKSYSVFLPGNPLLQKLITPTPRGDMTNHMYRIEAGRIGYAVAHAEIPGIIPQGEQVTAMLEGGCNGALKNMPGTRVLRRATVTLQGYPGRELDMETAAGKIIKARLYLVRQRLYQLMVDVPAAEASSREVTAFLTSFHIARP